MNVISAALAFDGRMCPMSCSAIWTAAIYILALRLLNVKTVVMSIYWHFLVKEGIFVCLSIRSDWWKLASGYAPKC